MLLILAGLCSISLLLFNLSKSGQRTLNLIQQERFIINNAGSLLSLADEMAMSTRGYYIVKEDQFLQEIQQARSGLTIQLGFLQHYAKTGFVKRSIADSISSLINKRIALSDSIVKYANGTQRSASKIKAYLNEGTGYNKAIREMVRVFTVQRLQHMHEMEKQAVSVNQTFRLLFVINILSLILVVIAGFIYLNKSFRAKAKAENIVRSYQQSNEFLNSLSEGLVVQNNKGYILECNLAAEKILGLTADQMQGKTSLDPLWHTVHEDGSNFPGNLHPSMQVLATGKSQENVIMGVHKPSGELTWININSHPVYAEEDGTVLSVVTTFIDITERKIAQQILEQDERRLRLALDKTGDNAWEHNFNTGTTWFSSKNNHFLGYSTQELNESENEDKWWSSVHPDDRQLLSKNDHEYKEGERESHSMEYRIYHKDGTMKWVLDRGVVIERNAKGKPVRIVGTHTDITHEKNRQEQLLQHEKEKKKEIVEAVIQAQETERHEIAYELHENINQVLSVGNMMLDMVATADETANSYIKQIKKSIGETIDEIRKISQAINPKSLELVGLPAAVDDLLKRITGESKLNISYHYDTCDEMPFQNKDAALTVFRTVQMQMINILRNADATAVTVHLSCNGKEVSLLITDNGTAVNRSPMKDSLGFRNMLNRAEHYNGTLAIDCSPGGGCKLSLQMPV